MGKLLKITGIILVVILLLMIVLPFLFKDKIIEIVKEEANKTLTAELNFEDAGLNFFSSFPNLNLGIDNLTIVNKAPFEGDTLVKLPRFDASIDLFSVFGDQIRIEGITLNEPEIFIYVLEDSTANYNIFAEDTAAVEDTAESDMNIALKNYAIRNGNIAYVDQTSNMVVGIKNINHSGSGDFTQNNFILETETAIEELTVEKGGIPYLNKVNTSLDLNLDINMAEKRFAFQENELTLNNLILQFEGWVQMFDESMQMDITFNSPSSDFRDIISLIPAIYSQNFNDIKSSGKMSIDGLVKGEYKDENLPQFNVNVNVQEGMFQYSKLPTPVNNVAIDMNINNPGGSAENMVINIMKFHMEIGNEPFDARLLLKNTTTNPYIETAMKGRLNLANIKNALYLEDITKLEGLIDADFEAKGTIAGKDIKAIENISASGNVSASNIVYASTGLKDEVNISQASLSLSPQSFKLINFEMKMGQNDLSASGSLNNVLSYLLSDAKMIGQLNISSNYFDLNPFMSDEETASANADTAGMQAVNLPENIRFTMNSKFNKVLFDNLTLTNVVGIIVLDEQRLSLKNLNMNLLGGSLIADGYYEVPPSSNPDILFNLSIKDFAIKETFEKFVTVQMFAPMAKYMEGKFSSKLRMTTALDQTMKPVWESFNSSGSLSLTNAIIQGFKPFEVVGSKLNMEALKSPGLNNVFTVFTIKNGRFYVEPFDFNVLNQKVTVAGSNGIDKSIDYSLGIEVPTSNLKQQGNSAISSLLKRDLNLITANSIKVKANIGGTIDDPSVTTSAGDIVEETTTQITDQIKEEVQSEIDKKKEEVEKKVEQKVDTLTNQLKKEAENKLKDLFKKRK